MKTHPCIVLLAALLSPAALLLVGGCSKSDKTDNSNTTLQDAKTSASDAYERAKVAVSDTWTSIKDFTYDKRVEFSAGIDRMSKDMDEEAAALKAKMAAAPDATAGARESAAKEYDEARANLKASLTELDNATAEHWADAKAKVVEAWKKVQAAWDKQEKANSAP